MKKFSIPCTFGGESAPFVIYIGEPRKDNHPLQNQSTWLSKERGGTISPAIMDGLDQLHKISIENNMPFEELCVYAVQSGGNQVNVDGSNTGGSSVGGSVDATNSAITPPSSPNNNKNVSSDFKEG